MIRWVAAPMRGHLTNDVVRMFAAAMPYVARTLSHHQCGDAGPQPDVGGLYESMSQRYEGKQS